MMKMPLLRFIVTMVCMVGPHWLCAQAVKTGEMWGFGYGGSGQFGFRDPVDANDRILLSTPKLLARDARSIAHSKGHYNIYVNDKHEAWGAGANNYGQVAWNNADTDIYKAVLVWTDISSVAMGAATTYFIKTDGTLWGVGRNQYGQLGDGTTIDRRNPILIDHDVTLLAAGEGHALYLKADGSLWAMGQGANGILGTGNKNNQSSPIKIASNIRFVSAGRSTSFWITMDGTLWGVGTSSSGEIGDGSSSTSARFSPVSIATGVVKVFAAPSHTLFVKTDGSLWGCGHNSQGELGDGTTNNRYAPIKIADQVVDAAGGNDHTIFLKSDGTLWAMGANDSAQLGVGQDDGLYVNDDGTINGVPKVNLSPRLVTTGVSAISTGPDHNFFIKSSLGALEAVVPAGQSQVQVPVSLSSEIVVNTDVSWLEVIGDNLPNGSGLIGLNVSPNTSGEDRTGSITVGDSTLKILQHRIEPGTYDLWGAGENGHGELAQQPLDTNRPTLMATSVEQAAGGGNYSLFIKQDHVLWAVGGNDYGQLGDGTNQSRTAPRAVANDVSRISAGLAHSLYLRADGTLWAMGRNDHGQLGDGTTVDRWVPTLLSTGVATMAAGGEHTLFVKLDGTLWAVGRNGDGQLGDSTTQDRLTPVQIDVGVSAVAAGMAHSIYLKANGTVWTVGQNTYGQLGDGTVTRRSTPIQVSTVATSVSAGSYHSLFRKADGTLWGMGRNDSSQLTSAATTAIAAPVKISSGIASFSGGNAHTLTLDSSGSLFAEGANQYGQLGLGSRLDTGILEKVADNVAGVAPGPEADHILFISMEGELFSAGRNDAAQLGVGYPSEVVLPASVAISVARMAKGGSASHSVIQKPDGTWWAAGMNDSGQLGDGTLLDRYATIPSLMLQGTAESVALGAHETWFISNDKHLFALGNHSGIVKNTDGSVASGVVSVAVGDGCALYIDQSQLLWAVGSNSSGQLGDGSTTSRNVPVLVGTEAAAVTTNLFHTLIVKTDGTLWACGSNSDGQLGDGTMTNRSTPVQIASDVVQACAGRYHSLFIKADGTLWAMGLNANGQLGDGSTISRNRPVQVASNVTVVTAGAYHSLFLKTDGSVWAMGLNASGQLLDGTTISRSAPVQVAAMAKDISAGAYHTLVLLNSGAHLSAFDPAPAVIAQQPQSLSVTIGAVGVFSARVAGMPVPSMQWQMLPTGTDTWSDIVGDDTYIGTNTETLTVVRALVGMNGYKYRLIATNQAGATMTEGVTLTVDSGINNAAPAAIEDQPHSLTVHAGETGVFIASVTGSPQPTMQWQVKATEASIWSNLSDDTVYAGTGTDTLTIAQTTTGMNGYQYRLVATNRISEATTVAVMLVVNPGITQATPAAIVTQPLAVTISAGEAATFSAGLGGVPKPAAQWQVMATGTSVWSNLVDDAVYSGVNTDTLVIAQTVTDMNGYRYRLLATNSSGGTTSDWATLTVTARDYSGDYFGTFGSGGHWALHVRSDETATYLAHLPSRASAIVADLTVKADGTFTVDGTEIKAAAGSSLSALALAGPEAPVTRTAAAAAYTLSGTISYNGAVSGQLTGLNETFSGAADAATGPAQGSAGLYTASALGTTSGTTYAIVGASGQTVVVTTGASVDGASGSLAGGQLSATTGNGAALTLTIDASAQTLAATVTPAGSATPVVYNGIAAGATSTTRVVNLSVRSQAGTGSQTLIVGLVVGGGGSKTLLLRGAGPALIPYGVTNALADPAIRLLDAQGAQLDTNDNWDGSLQTHFDELGASAFAANSKDAALYKQLAGGVYSMHVYPAGTGTGVVLAELYDADAAASGAEVVNISARTQVGTNENILILGFVITGNTPKTLLIRGMGPTLIPLGVTDALADPQLYLYQGSTVIATNDNWGGTAGLKTAVGTVGATPFVSDTSKDAAILVTLAPGVYSAQVSGVAATTGVGLVEIYLMP